MGLVLESLTLSVTKWPQDLRVWRPASPNMSRDEIANFTHSMGYMSRNSH